MKSADWKILTVGIRCGGGKQFGGNALINNGCAENMTGRFIRLCEYFRGETSPVKGEMIRRASAPEIKTGGSLDFRSLPKKKIKKIFFFA